MPDASEIETAFGRPLLAMIPSLALTKPSTASTPITAPRGGLVQTPLVQAEKGRGRGR
jgi:hypothetical protein